MVGTPPLTVIWQRASPVARVDSIRNALQGDMLHGASGRWSRSIDG